MAWWLSFRDMDERGEEKRGEEREGLLEKVQTVPV